MLEIFINQGLPLSMPYITYLIQEMVYYLKLVGLYVKLHTLRLIRIAYANKNCIKSSDISSKLKIQNEQLDRNPYNVC